MMLDRMETKLIYLFERHNIREGERSGEKEISWWGWLKSQVKARRDKTSIWVPHAGGRNPRT